MNLDISRILDDWPYEEGQVVARRTVGADGREKIQLRLDLGLLQMESRGRPDGQRPEGHESLLDYHERRLEAYRREHGVDEGFFLDAKACDQLRSEGTMYYHRYLALYVLEDFEGVLRDTLRNLRLFDFCSLYAKEKSDSLAMEQYRPYLIMMSARAEARIAMGKSQPKAALAAVRKGLEMIRRFYRRFDQENAFAASGEVATLRAMAKDIELRIPVSPTDQLERQLAKALHDERYEEAAQLRDRLREMQDQKRVAGSGKEEN